jgi:hypothetical protein
MAIKIDNKIVEYRVETDADDNTKSSVDNVIQMHEKLERPEMLLGSTYKIKTPHSEHALYITINDVLLNPDTEHEHRRPFEIFINSKNMEHYQWIVALTLIMSAVFRKGGDVTFLVEELRSVFDPSGGYFKKGGKFMPSLVAEIGEVIESHMRMIGLMKDDTLDDAQKAFIEEKRAQLNKTTASNAAAKQAPKLDHTEANPSVSADEGDYPASATLCGKCHTRAMIVMDGCETCLSCGYSKCG